MTGRVLVPGVPHKPQGDSKSAVLSLNGGLLPKIATSCQGERKIKYHNSTLTRTNSIHLVISQDYVTVIMCMKFHRNLFKTVKGNATKMEDTFS